MVEREAPPTLLLDADGVPHDDVVDRNAEYRRGLIIAEPEAAAEIAVDCIVGDFVAVVAEAGDAQDADPVVAAARAGASVRVHEVVEDVGAAAGIRNPVAAVVMDNAVPHAAPDGFGELHARDGVAVHMAVVDDDAGDGATPDIMGAYLYPVGRGPRDDESAQRVMVVADVEPVARGRVDDDGARGLRHYRDRGSGRAIPLRLDRRFVAETRQHEHGVAAIGYLRAFLMVLQGVAGFLARVMV